MKATTKRNDFRPVRDSGLGGAAWGVGLEEVERIESSQNEEIDGSNNAGKRKKIQIAMTNQNIRRKTSRNIWELFLLGEFRGF